MQTSIIPDRGNKWADIQRQISEFYSSQTRLLVSHLYTKHGYTYQQIADILGVTKSAVAIQFPKNYENQGK